MRRHSLPREDTMTVEKISVRYRRPQTLTGKEMWDAPEPPPEMVWEICPYLRMGAGAEQEGCQQCPAWDEDKDYGKVQRGCYGFAAEACRVVVAMQKKHEPA